jgi:hypothetical protein
MVPESLLGKEDCNGVTVGISPAFAIKEVRNFQRMPKNSGLWQRASVFARPILPGE